MKLRVQYDRKEFRGAAKLSPTVMQPNPNHGSSHAPANGSSLTLQPELLNRPLPAAAAASASDTNEVRVPMTGAESSGGASSRRSRAHSHSHSHSHGHVRAQRASSEPDPDSSESDVDSGEPSTSLSELRYLLRWLQKSLPFLVILCAKLVLQHTLGLAVGIGLLMTFFYVNKSIQTQVFLKERHSKLQCLWLLIFLCSSTALLYYTFSSETLHYCLVFLNSNYEPLGFWDVLWAVGISNFVIKFISMGIKCLILLVPASLLTFRAQGRWLMMAEETGQLHQAMAPVPLWFRYLVTYHEADGAPGLTLGILLALLYLILKLLGLYGQMTSILKTVKLLLKGEHTGAAATRTECSEAGGVCPICQGEYREPRALICQHIFCDECIALWFNREKSCPLCRTVITEKVYTWRDGATSPHLQIY